MWTNKGYLVENYPVLCINHPYAPGEGYEWVMVGRFGEIYANDKETYKAYIYGNVMRNRLNQGKSFITFPKADLVAWRKKLKIALNPAIQKKYMQEGMESN